MSGRTRYPAKPVTLESIDRRFPSQKAAVEHLRSWAKSLPVDQPLYGSDLDLARELFERIADESTPLPTEPADFRVHAQFSGGRELRYAHDPIRFEDGTGKSTSPVSLPKAVAGTKHSGPNPMRILRAAVQDQRDEFIATRMVENPVCEMCFCVVAEHDADADHVRPFVDIANEWLAFGPNQWARTARGGYDFASRAGRFFWQRHHLNAATWRLLCRECHHKHSAQQARERASAA